MNKLYANSPEELDALRTSVGSWLKVASSAVRSFQRKDGSFQRDSKVGTEKRSLTTTARCYMALAYASCHLRESETTSLYDLRQNLSNYLRDLPIYTIASDIHEMRVGKKKNKKLDPVINNFELAHLADFSLVRNFLKTFGDNRCSDIPVGWPKHLEKFDNFIDECLKRKISLRISTAKTKREANICSGEILFDEGEESSKHFFVTLHSLRALEILRNETTKPVLERESLEYLVASAEQFCVRQCYYCQRQLRHRQDPARLAFAGVVYCMYEPQVDKDLIVAIVEALAETQRESGNWPVSHPVIRGGKDPWYIATHELALCLTWLYFQPRVPDVVRPHLLSMMERYFKKWVIPTYRRVRQKNDHSRDAESDQSSIFKGWYDDSATGHDKVVGWATAIVCHFLANYNSVLSDHINRRVIESLELQASSGRYLIDENEPDHNPRWSKKTNEGVLLACWPDLPPIGWVQGNSDVAQIARRIEWSWTDPSPNALLSKIIAEKVLSPIMRDHQFKPSNNVAGILDGPPGTRKTSLVGTLSRLLEWPYIPVPASVIFDRGFDLMEARATEVFRRLNYLTRCIIFFDEFEEFFRSREDEQKNADNAKAKIIEKSTIHDRTIAAFTTSAMLPRLQDLRDQEACLIFLATNHLEKMDDAIVRLGRFDFRETVGHPNIARIIGPEGYLDRPTERTLVECGVSHCLKDMTVTEVAKLQTYAGAVKEALEDCEIRLEVLKFNKARKQEGDPGAADDEIKFSFVEAALYEVVKRAERSKDKKSLKTAAMNAIFAVIKSTVSEGKGPPTLIDSADSKQGHE